MYYSLKQNSKYDDILVGLDISGDPRVGDLRSVLDKMTRLRSEDGVKMAIHLAEVVNPEEISAVIDTCHVYIAHQITCGFDSSREQLPGVTWPRCLFCS